MLNFKKYIYDKISSQPIYIKNELELHFYSEFILNESLRYSYFQILEKYGSYIGQKELLIELSKSIYDIIRNNEPEDKIQLDKTDIKGYSNIFFNSLIIYLSRKTGYIASKKDNYIKKDKLFNQVIININPNEYNTYEDILRCLMHEMLHAYNDFQSYLKNSKFTLDDLTNKNSSYYKTIFTSDITPKNICKRILNNITKWEQNAYINELSIELENGNFNINKYNKVEDAYKEAYNIFKNSEVWIQYSTLWTYLIELNKSNNIDYINEFTNEYNNINNTNLTFNKIYKKLDNIFNKILNKMESKIPKIFYEYYKNQILNTNESLVLGRQNSSLIKFLRYINEVDSKNTKEGYKVYVNNRLDNTFTNNSKKWKKIPKIGNGWYCGGKIFKIIKIKDNNIYTITQ